MRRSRQKKDEDEAPVATRRAAPEGMVSLSAAGFDELRELGMSVTQAKRVIRYRDERDGFRSSTSSTTCPASRGLSSTGSRTDWSPSPG